MRAKAKEKFDDLKNRAAFGLLSWFTIDDVRWMLGQIEDLDATGRRVSRAAVEAANRAILQRAETQAAMSVLLDVQADCIELRKKLAKVAADGERRIENKKTKSSDL